MSDVLDEAEAVVQCKECPWYKACVLPMRYTMDDLRRQWQQAMPVSGIPTGAETNLQNLLANIASAAEHIFLEGCPIFVHRLRANPRLAERIKQMMQTWGRDEGEAAR